ncbi:predicted protein, partial [Nematostella vectensis]
GMLFPRASESREIKSLDGIWDFRADDSPQRSKGFDDMWFANPLTETGHTISMPVPSSFNDVTELRWLRDFVGWVWYERTIHVPQAWTHLSRQTRVVIRFESVHYYCKVWLNGMEILSHEGGHLPFEADITDNLDYYHKNRITVAVNNTLSDSTVPPGESSVSHYKGETEVTQEYDFDFFNYAGIHRSVKLYTTPTTYLTDITIATDVLFNTGIVKFVAVIATRAIEGVSNDITMRYELLDANGGLMAVEEGAGKFAGELKVPGPQLWWPVGMSAIAGYLYSLKISTIWNHTADVYRLPVGIRTVRIDGNRFLINDAPFYFKGFGKHEDAEFRGRGFDYPQLVKDFNLLKWFGANSFRTSHYPYSEETMDLADRLGIVIIDEGSAVGFSKPEYFNDKSLSQHLSMITDLIRRDKNHPSVVMWSVANEPHTDTDTAAAYLRSVIDLAKKLDKQARPVTYVTMLSHEKGGKEDKAAQFCDVIAFNRYFGWYTFPGQQNRIAGALEWEMRGWFDRYHKPVLITEYGAEAIAGLHRDPSVMFTEEYQTTDSVVLYHAVREPCYRLLIVGYVICFIFSFFSISCSLILATDRTGGNRKGILTRERNPKASAHVLRSRYQSI